MGAVFNNYNVNILFTVSALPSRVSLQGAPSQMMVAPPGQQTQFRATDDEARGGQMSKPQTSQMPLQKDHSDEVPDDEVIDDDKNLL